MELVFNTAPDGRGSGHVCTANCGCTPPTRNVYNAEEASKHAAKFTIDLGHLPAAQHSLRAVKAVNARQSGKAAKSHIAAAAAHEDEALNLRKQNRHDLAEQHHEAASAHRVAASMHRAGLPDDDPDRDLDPQPGGFANDNSEERKGRSIDEGANAVGVGGSVPAGQGRGDITTANVSSGDTLADYAIEISERMESARDVEGMVQNQLEELYRADTVLNPPLRSTKQIIANSRKLVEEGLPSQTVTGEWPARLNWEAVAAANASDATFNAAAGSDFLYDTPPLASPEVDAAYDGRKKTSKKLRAGQEEDDAEDESPLDKYLGAGEGVGTFDLAATRAAELGFQSYDSHQDVREYGAVIQRNQQTPVSSFSQDRSHLVGNTATTCLVANNAGVVMTVPGARSVLGDWGSLDLAQNAAETDDNASPGASARLVSYFKTGNAGGAVRNRRRL